MTDIREGIEKLMEDRFRPPAEGAGLNWDRNFNRLLADEILTFLDANGLRIIKEKELPEGLLSRIPLIKEILDELGWKYTERLI